MRRKLIASPGLIIFLFAVCALFPISIWADGGDEDTAEVEENTATIYGTISVASDTSYTPGDISVFLRVKDDESAPLRLAELRRAGEYSVAVPAGKDVSLVFLAEDFARFDTEVVRLETGESLEIDIVFETLETCLIRGVVLDAEDSKPLADVSLRPYLRGRGSRSMGAQSGADGSFELAAQPGVCKVRAELEGYRSDYSDEFVLYEGEVRDIEISIEKIKPADLPPKDATISGRVTDAASGKALGNIRIYYYLYIEGMNHKTETYTDSEGRYELKVPSGWNVDVYLWGSGYSSKYRRNILLEKNERKTFDFQLDVYSSGDTNTGATSLSTIDVVVVDGDTGEPIAGARVYSTHIDTEGRRSGRSGRHTGESGDTIITYKPGTCRIEIVNLGYLPYDSGDIELLPGTTFDMEIRLVPGKTVLSGLVVDHKTRGAIAGAVLVVRNNDVSGSRMVLTGADGRFESVVAPGQTFVYITAAGYETPTSAFVLEIEPGKTEKLPVKLRRLSAVLAGIVLDSKSGMPVSSSVVTIMRVDEDRRTTMATTISDVNGMFSYPVGEGDYRLRVQKPGYRDNETLGLQVAEDKTVSVEIAITPHDAVVSGRLVDAETGEPLAGRFIEVTLEDFTARIDFSGRNFAVRLSSMRPYQKSEDGAFSIDVASDSYVLACFAEGYYPYDQEITVEEGDELSLDIKMKPLPAFDAEVSGIVVESVTGASIPYASIEVYFDSYCISYVRCDDSGRFAAAVPAGQVILAGRYYVQEHGTCGGYLELELKKGDKIAANLVLVPEEK